MASTRWVFATATDSEPKRPDRGAIGHVSDDVSDDEEWSFCASVESLSAALQALRSEGAVSLPVLSEATRERLLGPAKALPYRKGTPVIGKGDRRVYQDFALTVAFEPNDIFHRFAEAFGRIVIGAAEALSPVPLSAGFCFNDLILQHYPVGAAGITPHRDHITYRELVALISLSGRGRFTLCEDRSGAGARHVPIPPGSALLMVAPGFDRRQDRPFHALTDITQERYSLGLRYLVQE